MLLDLVLEPARPTLELSCRKDTMRSLRERLIQEDGAIGYIALWILGVPASVLFVIFLLRGCT